MLEVEDWVGGLMCRAFVASVWLERTAVFFGESRRL